MKSALYWIRFGLYVGVAVAMLVFGGLFIRHVYVCLWLDNGGMAFSSFMLGVVLFLVGGGLLMRTLGHTFRRTMTRIHIHP